MDLADQESIIEMLADNELALAGLYMAFSKNVPAYEDFWRRMSLEERGHMEWLLALKSNLRSERLALRPGRFGMETITGLARRILDRTMEVRGPLFPADKALETGLEMETDLMERRFFDIFEQDTPMVKDVFERMNQNLAQHRKKLSDEYEHFRVKKR